MNKNLYDLNVWVKAKDLAKQIYLLTNNENFNKDRILRDQMRRAVISVSSNIAEGAYRSGKKEFKFFLKMAKGSCGELISQITISKELGFLESNIDAIIDDMDHLSRMIGKLMVAISVNTVNGVKAVNTVNSERS